MLALCKDIKISKSSGLDGISSRVLRDAFRVIIPELVFMFNLSFSTGLFPDTWKQATVIPLYKGGNSKDVSNYRPVSLLPLPGKLIEKVAHSILATFLEGNGIISDKQGGFRRGFSTASSIADLTDIIFNNINNGLTTVAAFVDLKKAFDTLNHSILLKKLKCYGIAGDVLKWCTNYLWNRSQQVMANGIKSVPKEVYCGVPQGSVLGPLFFILYVNDVQEAVTGADLQLYADDTVIHAAGTGHDLAVAKLQPALNRFAFWCKGNKLLLNAVKTKLMVFGTRHKIKKAKDVMVTVDRIPLQLVPTYKYLGVTLDSTLSYNYHVKTVASIVAYKANLLAKI